MQLNKLGKINLLIISGFPIQEVILPWCALVSFLKKENEGIILTTCDSSEATKEIMSVNVLVEDSWLTERT